MRIAPFWLLLSLLLSPAVWAQSDDSAPKKEIADGMTITALGQSGDFRQHQLLVWLATVDDPTKKKVTAALDALGLRGAGMENHMPNTLIVPLQGEKCDGSRIGSVPRAKLVEALEATGSVRMITIRSFSSPNTGTREAVQKKALGNAVQNAHAKAKEIARLGGGQLGKLLGMEYEVEGSDDVRILLLTRDRVQEQEAGGDRIRVTVRYSLR